MHERHEPSAKTGSLDDKVTAPSTYYDDPEDVVTDKSLSAEDKRRVLESWLQDAKRLAESEGENMSGGEPNREREIALALQALQS